VTLSLPCCIMSVPPAWMGLTGSELGVPAVNAVDVRVYAASGRSATDAEIGELVDEAMRYWRDEVCACSLPLPPRLASSPSSSSLPY